MLLLLFFKDVVWGGGGEGWQTSFFMVYDKVTNYWHFKWNQWLVFFFGGGGSFPHKIT